MAVFVLHHHCVCFRRVGFYIHGGAGQQLGMNGGGKTGDAVAATTAVDIGAGFELGQVSLGIARGSGCLCIR